MDVLECPRCHERVRPREPRRRLWVLMVTFWAFSLLFGIGASFSSGWGGLMLVAWLGLARAVAVTARRPAGLVCPACGASLLDRPPRGTAEVV